MYCSEEIERLVIQHKVADRLKQPGFIESLDKRLQIIDEVIKFKRSLEEDQDDEPLEA